jgi:hypothetical protein
MSSLGYLRVLGAALLASLGLAVGCSSGSDADDPTTSTAELSTTTTTTELASTAIISTATTTSPTTTTSGTIDPAQVEGPAEWVPVVVDVYNRLHSLDVDPDPARVAGVFSEQYSGFQDQVDTATFLSDEGVHADGPVRRVIRVEGPTDQTGGTVQFVVTVEYQPFNLVYDDGRVFQEITDVPGEIQELLRLTPDGPAGTYRILVKEAV